MSCNFRVVEHVVEASHIPGEPFTLINPDDDVLHLAVKQYIPLSNPDPQQGDVTIIGAHANGFPKELYEPMWEELIRNSERKGYRIRSIWIADMACQGWSSVVNESQLAYDVSWHDHSRDLLHMINHFRKEMPKPIVGVAHSVGGWHLSALSHLHPRLFETMVLIDPIISTDVVRAGNGGTLAMLSYMRQDKWTTREAATESFKKNFFYKGWDPRAFDLWCRYGLRDLPSKLYPDSNGVTLTTTKHQEILCFIRALPENLPDTELPMEETHADYNSSFYNSGLEGTYRSDVKQEALRLPTLRPSVFFIFGEHSPLSDLPGQKYKVTMTGTGLGGSGGEKLGRVKGHVIKGAGHMIPMEKIEATGEAVGDWLGSELKRWRDNDTIRRKEWGRLTDQEKVEMPKKMQTLFDSKVKEMMAVRAAKRKAREASEAKGKPGPKL